MQILINALTKFNFSNFLNIPVIIAKQYKKKISALSANKPMSKNGSILKIEKKAEKIGIKIITKFAKIESLNKNKNNKTLRQ